MFRTKLQHFIFPLYAFLFIRIIHKQAAKYSCNMKGKLFITTWKFCKSLAKSLCQLVTCTSGQLGQEDNLAYGFVEVVVPVDHSISNNIKCNNSLLTYSIVKGILSESTYICFVYTRILGNKLHFLHVPLVFNIQ